jgi:mono/diheme cytochrome c family protein
VTRCKESQVTDPQPAARLLRKRLLPGAALLLLVLTAACGGSGGDDDAGDGGNSGSGAGDAMEQLFAAKGCAECHGARGQGVSEVPNSQLAGTRLIIQQFSTRVRNGKGAAMDGYGPEQITDEEIRAMWEWLRES